MQNRLRNADGQIANVGPAIFGLEQHRYRIDRLFGLFDRNFGGLVDGGALGPKLAEHVADFVGAALKGKEFR